MDRRSKAEAKIGCCAGAGDVRDEATTAITYACAVRNNVAIIDARWTGRRIVFGRVRAKSNEIGANSPHAIVAEIACHNVEAE